ncbi:MAG: XTP/dITP diphosphatase [Anaerolineae bacterium]
MVGVILSFRPLPEAKRNSVEKREDQLQGKGALTRKSPARLLIATNNPGKLEEYRCLLSDLHISITSLRDEGIDFEPEETGATFEENATLKAIAFARQSGLPVLADDSGLEIDALDGAPGVHSARYGDTQRGEDVQRYELVLRQLEGVPWDKRTARFRCVIAVATKNGQISTAEGVIEGFIAFEPQGEHGFGYDPIFFIPEYGCTMAQLPSETKNRISHRAKAAQAALPILRRLVVSADESRDAPPANQGPLL